MKIDEHYSLIGAYPSNLDLGNCDLDFERLLADPYANLVISNEDKLEHLRIGRMFRDNNSVTIKDCKKLKTIEIYDDGFEDAAKWIICNNLPALEKLSARGDLLSLELTACDILREVDFEGCKKIARFKCASFNFLQKLNINGCIKLSRVEGIIPEISRILKIDSAIINNSNAVGDLIYPFSDLTFKQINELLELVNFVLSAEARSTSSFPFINYSINLLEPGEYTYTGNTGEVYAYDLYDGSGYGEHSPEDYLLNVLSKVANVLEIDGVNYQEKINNTIAYLQALNLTKLNQVNQSSKRSDQGNFSAGAAFERFTSSPMVRAPVSGSYSYFPTLIIGCKVNHTKFGDGVVLNREGVGDEQRAEVEFSSAGIKWLALSVAKLTILE